MKNKSLIIIIVSFFFMISCKEPVVKKNETFDCAKYYKTFFSDTFHIKKQVNERIYVLQ